MLANVGTTKSGSTDFDSRGMYAMKPALSGALSDLDPCIAAEEPPKTQYKRCNASCIEPFLLHACLRMHATRQHTKVPCSNGRGAATAYFDAASASSYRSCGRNNAHMPVMLACVPGCAVRQRRNLSRPSVLAPRQLIPNPGASGGRVNWPNQRCNPMLMHKDCACGLGSDAAGSLQRKKKKKQCLLPMPLMCLRIRCDRQEGQASSPAVSSIWCPWPARICAIDCMHALHQRM